MMIVKVLQKVFKKPSYTLLAVTVSASVFVFAVWLPNIPLILRVMRHPGIPLSQKLKLPISLLGSIVTNFTLLSAFYTIAIAVLTGINISLLVYELKERRISQLGAGAGVAGIISSVLGIGCSACGSLILTFLLGTIGGASILAVLPLHGRELGIIGVILLGISTYLLAKQVTKPLIC